MQDSQGQSNYTKSTTYTIEEAEEKLKSLKTLNDFDSVVLYLITNNVKKKPCSLVILQMNSIVKLTKENIPIDLLQFHSEHLEAIPRLTTQVVNEALGVDFHK